MSTQCPVCHHTLDAQFEAVQEYSTSCKHCSLEVQVFQWDNSRATSAEPTPRGRTRKAIKKTIRRILAKQYSLSDGQQMTPGY
jgi:hypothetical protein